MNSWIIVDKPIGTSSFYLTKIIGALFSIKTGHCGTLDPFASGFLLIAINKTTKLVKYATNIEKNYLFNIRWKVNTNTSDLTGLIVKNHSFKPNKNEILSRLHYFTNNIKQKAHIFSSVKVEGVRAYGLDKQDRNIKLKFRETNLKMISLLTNSNNESFSVTTKKGFYIRSFAKDLGNTLKTSAHVSKIRRIINPLLKNINFLNIQKFKNALRVKKIYSCIKSSIFCSKHIFNNIFTHHIKSKKIKEIERLKNKQEIFAKLSLNNGTILIVKYDCEFVSICYYRNSYLILITTI